MCLDWFYNLIFKRRRKNKMIAKFEVFKDKSKQWRFRLRARNGKIICASESYISRRNAVLGIKSIQDCASDAVILYIQN